MTYAYVSGSPSAAETPPRDRVWRAMVRDAIVVARRGSATRLGLHFALEPSRARIDLDNLLRLAVAGIQDGGAIPRPTSGVDEYVATKRSVLASPGLLVTFDSTPVIATDHDDDVELRVESAELPREGATDSKRRWRGYVEAAWQWPPTEHPVALNIEARTRYSLVAHLKPIIDGLEAYLGRDPWGRLEFCPADHKIVWLGIRRTTAPGPALRVRASTRPPADWLDGSRLIPRLPRTDPDSPAVAGGLMRIEDVHAWEWIYGQWLP